jgi:hypothetical protein
MIVTERRFFGPLRVILSFLIFSSACAVGEIGDGSGGVAATSRRI